MDTESGQRRQSYYSQWALGKISIPLLAFMVVFTKCAYLTTHKRHRRENDPLQSSKRTRVSLDSNHQEEGYPIWDETRQVVQCE